MDRHEHLRLERNIDGRAAHLVDAGGAAEDGSGGAGAEAHHHTRSHQPQLGFQPRMTRPQLVGGGRAVDAALPSRFPGEVLHRVGDEDPRARHPDLLQSLVENAARGADERMPLTILLVAGLFADEHEICARRAFSRDRLRGAAPQVASPARREGSAKLGQRTHRCGGLRGVVGRDTFHGVRRLAKVQVHAEEHQRPEHDCEHSRHDRADPVHMREVVMRAGDHDADHDVEHQQQLPDHDHTFRDVQANVAILELYPAGAALNRHHGANARRRRIQDISSSTGRKFRMRSVETSASATVASPTSM